MRVKKHVKDSDCFLEQSGQGECIVCGVHHGPPCRGEVHDAKGRFHSFCNGRAFHKPGCMLSDDKSKRAPTKVKVKVKREKKVNMDLLRNQSQPMVMGIELDPVTLRPRRRLIGDHVHVFACFDTAGRLFCGK